MAKKIKNSDIVDSNLLSGAIKQAQDLLKVIGELETSFKKTLKVQTEYLKNTKISTFEEYKATEDAIKKTKKATEDLNKAEQDRIKTENTLVELQKEEALALEKSRVKISERKKLLKEQAREELGLIGAYEKSSKNLERLRKQYQNLAVAGRENGKVAKGLKQEIDKLDATLKKADASTGKFNRNVGNYKGAMLDAASSSQIFGGKLGGVVSNLQSLAAAGPLGAAAAAALGVVLGGLNLVLTETEAGLDFVERKVMGFRSATKELGVIIKDMGWRDWANLLVNTGSAAATIAEKLKEAAEAGEAYADALDLLEDIEIDNIVPLQKLNEEIAKNKLAMEDANATTEDKIKLAKEAIALDEKMTGVALRNGKATIVGGANTQAGQAQAQLDSYNTYFNTLREPTSVDKRKRAELEAEVSRITQEAFEGRKRLASQIENLERTLETERLNRAKANSERRIALIEDEYTRELELLNLKYSEINRTAKKNGEDLILVEKNYQKELRELNARKVKSIEGVEKMPMLSGIGTDRDTLKDQAENVKAQSEKLAQDLEDIENKKVEEEKLRAQQLKEIRQAVTDAAIEQINKEYEARANALDKEIDRRKDSVGEQQRLAEQGLENNIAFEKKMLAEKELEAERLEKRKLKREKTLAFVRLIASYAENGQGDTALLKAAGQMAAAEAVSAFFFEGTENVEKALGNKGKAHNGRDGYRGRTKSGHLIAFDGKERILSEEHNRLMGDTTNDEAARIVYEARMNKKKTKQEASDRANVMYLNEMRKLNENIKNQKTINVNWDGLDKRIVQTVEHGMRTTVKYLQQKPRF